MSRIAASITMSMSEVDRLKTVQRVVDRMLRVGQAADGLGISCRQVERLVKRYEAGGAAGLVSAKRGRPSNNQLSDGIASRALALIRQRYADFGPTLACEKLRELHGVSLSKETIRRLMIEAGLWKPRRQRAAQIHQPRNRRACVGELIQIDGSDHAWFEGRAEACTLLVYIDDATSRLMQLHFVPTESSFAYFEATRTYLERHGKPVAFYSDKAAVFRTTQESIESGRGVTQFGRVLYELNIDSWCANSSQAKGRVERANLTLQDRLVKELRLRGISSQKAANAYAPRFVADFNKRFAKPPTSEFDAHRPVRDDEDLDLIFTWRLPRKVSLSLTLQHDRVRYLLPDSRTRQTPESSFIATSTSSSTQMAASSCAPMAQAWPTSATTSCPSSTPARSSRTSDLAMPCGLRRSFSRNAMIDAPRACPRGRTPERSRAPNTRRSARRDPANSRWTT